MTLVQDTAELLSLALTSPTLFLSFWVIVLFHQEALKALKSNERTPLQFFALGIMVGFIGSFLDNLYWGVAWTCSYLELDAAAWWFNNGVFANIPFRQGCGVVAAYFHIKCAMEYINDEPSERDMWILKNVIGWSLIFGILGVFLLSVFRVVIQS